MLLKHIYLYLKLDEYPDELATPFGFHTRYVCNFLERRLRELKFRAEGFSKICVRGCHVPDESCPIVPDNAALASVAFDEQRYRALTEDEYHEFFIAMLREGFENCARQHSIPLEELLDTIDDFRRGGFKNEWVQKTKLLRAAGLRASLMCRLAMDRFVLTLRLERRGDIVFEEPVLETKPDELIFDYRVKDVALEGDTVVVKDKFGRPTFSLPLSSVA